MIVAEPTSLPVFDGRVLEPVAGKILVSAAAVPEGFVHTLRELEGARLDVEGGSSGQGKAAAILVRISDFPAKSRETIEMYIQRLRASTAVHAADSAFRVVLFEETSDRERPELTSRLSAGPLRILDVGCGAGAGIAAAKARNAAWEVTGIEWDPVLANRARSRCDRVLEGDLARILPTLEREATRWDAIVFADVRRVAAPGARLLVTVPNVGHLSIARDLVAGRFDPIPAGLTESRHLRWFTRGFLDEALRESGWKPLTIESERGAPAPDGAVFLALIDDWRERDAESLGTYQWVALAVNSPS